MLSGTEKQLLAELNSNEYPEVAEDGKGFFVVWADCRAQVGYKNKKHAIDFIEQGDRDANAVNYREREKGETVRNLFSSDKSSTVHSMLFKEAEDKKEHRDKIVIHDVLFDEVEDRENILEEDEGLEKEAHAQQAGSSNLKNSGWNTNWRFGDPSSSIEKVKKQVYQKSVPFFKSLQGQADLRPHPLSFLFHYYRTILPGEHDESSGKAQNALDVLEGVLPGFQNFQQEIESFNIPLNPYFMVSEFSGDDGRVDKANLTSFISQEQGKPLALPDGKTEVPSSSHYQEHASQINNGRSVSPTGYRDKIQILSMDKIDTASAKMLKYAIADRVKDGYTLKDKRMGTADQSSSLVDALQGLYKKRLVDNGIDFRDPNQAQQASIYRYHYGKMGKNIRQWSQDESSIDLTEFELKLILQHMVHMGGSPPETPPDQFKASVKTLYAANGWDSPSDDPNTKMLTLPALRQLPRGEVVYDRGNVNMGYDHLVLNWKQGLAQLIQKWGPKCAEWIKTLQSGQGMQAMAQQSPEVGEAWKNVMSLQSGNRTGAETLLDLFREYPTWEEFDKNHIQKSLASEIRSVNKLRKNQVSLQSFKGGNLLQQIQGYVPQIIKIGESDPKFAHDQLTYLSSELVQHYMKGTLDWKTLTLALHALNTPIASAGLRYQNEGGKMQRVSNGLTVHPAKRSKTSIDRQGFELLKQYGYQVAKMMDFLSSAMYRSCYEQISTPTGFEHKFGHRYSTSSGTSKGGDIILTVEYSQLDAVPSESQVDVTEQLTFSLGQKTGANDEPIFLRSSLPWEQMVQVFNEMYPEAGYQFNVVHDSISGDLDMLEHNVKEALKEALGDNNIKVVYHNSQGHEFILTSEEIADEEMTLKENAGETDLVDETQTALNPAQPAQTEEWTMGPEAFNPSPSPEEIEEQVMPSADPQQLNLNFDSEQQASRQTPQQMPKPMADPMSQPINDPSQRSIQKRDTKKRRLLRQNAGLGSIEERLQKAANRLDECNEFSVADKLDLLLQKINEG